jgi:hypothetical protein
MNSTSALDEIVDLVGQLESLTGNEFDLGRADTLLKSIIERAPEGELADLAKRLSSMMRDAGGASGNGRITHTRLRDAVWRLKTAAEAKKRTLGNQDAVSGDLLKS